MSSQSRLLAMLNSGPSSSSSIQPPLPNTSSPPITEPNQSSHQPPITSPPQQVSLHDLFRNITSPPLPYSSSTLAQPSSSASSSPPPPFSNSDNPHQAKLLSMLGGMNLGASESPSLAQNGNRQGMETAPLGTPSQQVNLLNLFKSSTPSAPMHEPVINHSNPSTSSQPDSTELITPQLKHNQPEPDIKYKTEASVPPPSGAKSPTHLEEPKMPSPAVARQQAIAPSSPQTVATEISQPPKRSMFEFISPFDVFDKPPPKAPSPAVKPNRVESPSSNPPARTAKPEVDSDEGVKAAKEVNTKQAIPMPAPKPTTIIAQAELPIEVKKEHTSREVSPAPVETSIWRLSKVARDIKGKGPQQKVPSHFDVDLSQPGTERLITEPGHVQIIPITIMKTDGAKFRKGRIVGMTANCIAYAMSKGRVRLIVQETGKKLVLQLPPSAKNGPIIDLAVLPRHVAVVGADHSVTVFAVPEIWDKDDPPCHQVVHITPSKRYDEDSLGKVFKVEWFKRNSQDWLAIGGSGGVVLLHPEDLPQSLDIDSIGQTLLTAEGPLVSFCFNQSNQAVGLLSATHFTLYNASTSNRVWHRELPTSSPSTSACSVQFCESNIIVGRADNTILDLIQITTDLAVLSTVKFTSPSSRHPEANHCQVIYDSSESTLWVSPFSRGTLLAFHFALKGQPPIKEASTTKKGTIEAFDQVLEYPFEPLTSLVIGPKSLEADPDFFFSTPNGFSQASIDKSLLTPAPRVFRPHTPETVPTHLASPKADVTPAYPAVTPTAKKVQSTETNRKVPKPSTPSKGNSKTTSPTIGKGDLSLPSMPQVPLFPDETISKAKAVNGITNETSSKSAPPPASDEVAKLLKKTEDRLSNNIKQQFANQIAAIHSKVDSIGKSDSSAEIASKVEKQIKAALPTMISQEIRQSVLPTLTEAAINEVRNNTSRLVVKAIADNFHNLPKDVEQRLGPIITRSIVASVKSAVEQAMQESLHKVIIPSLHEISTHLAQKLSSEFRSEMVQVRKDFEHENESTAELVQTLARSLTELKENFASLSDRLSGRQAQMSPQHPHPSLPKYPQAPSNTQHTSVVTPQTQDRAPTPPRWEDIFLAALHDQNDSTILDIIQQYNTSIDQVVPDTRLGGGSSILSQAVLLTLTHRLSLAGRHILPTDQMFARVFNWASRAANQINPNDPAIMNYYGRVSETIVQNLTEFIDKRLLADYRFDPSLSSFVESVRSVLVTLAMKNADVRGGRF